MKSIIATVVQCLLTIFLYSVGIFILGLSLFPGILLCYFLWTHFSSLPLVARFLIFSFGIATAFFIFGITQMFVSGTIRLVFRLNLKEGEYDIISLGAFKWMFANSLYQLMAATFMDFILLTPFANVFHRLMGAKLGRNVQINSKFCADMSLLEVGDGSVIGGHSTVISHSFERNRLILKKVKIGKKVIIGLNSVILPGCEIEDGALIAAGAVLNKNTHVGRREVYCGVPAESAKARHVKED